MARPRFLLPLALLSFLYGGTGLVSAWATIAVLTGPHDPFISSARDNAGGFFGITPQLGTPDEQRRHSEREAEVLWSRKNALIPLSVGSIIACTLVLLGAGRSLRRSPRSAWGVSAWQLGALLGLPCAALEGVIGWLCSRDLLAATASFSDPLSKQLRDSAPLLDHVVIAKAALLMVYLGSVALYLQSEAVKRWASSDA